MSNTEPQKEKIMNTICRAIERSVSNKPIGKVAFIVSLPYSRVAYDLLQSMCVRREDHNIGTDLETNEFLGKQESGREWRVHLCRQGWDSVWLAVPEKE